MPNGMMGNPMGAQPPAGQPIETAPPVIAISFPPDGYTTGSNLPENVSIKLKGEGWKLVTLNIGAESEYRVSVESDSGLDTHDPRKKNLEGVKRFFVPILSIVFVLPAVSTSMRFI